MTDRVAVVGGPLDGLMAAPASGRFAWLNAAGGAKVLEPTESRGGRVLYMLSARGYYIYAGDTHYLCESCGAFHGKAEGGAERPPCPFESGMGSA